MKGPVVRLNSKAGISLTVALTLITAGAVAGQSITTASTSNAWQSIRVDSNTVSFSAGAEGDARKIEEYLRQSINALVREFDDGDTPYRLMNIELAVYVHSQPNEYASEATATLQTSYDGKKYTGILHLLRPSVHSPQSRTSVNEPKDEYYFRKVVVHEYSTMLLDLITQEKEGEGWRFFAAPSWFVQGYEEYLGLFCSSEHSRTTTYSKYLSLTKSDPARVSNDFGLTVRDAYVDGAVLVKFMHDEFGKKRVHAVLKSREPSFGAAMRKELGVGLDEFFERWRTWLAAQTEK